MKTQATILLLNVDMELRREGFNAHDTVSAEIDERGAAWFRSKDYPDDWCVSYPGEHQVLSIDEKGEVVQTLYYFQVEERGRTWASTPAFALPFPVAGMAQNFAQELANVNNKQVRFSDNADLQRAIYFQRKISNQSKSA